MINHLALILILISGWCAPVSAGLAAKAFAKLPVAPDGERFLFVVDVSSRMEDLQTANEATLFEMLRQGVSGQMRAGDTYGVWTFNKSTQAGNFPMQVWDPKRSTQQGTIAASFINHATYEKASNVKQLMANLAALIQVVSNVTIFVISDGHSDMTGTPFDKAINAAYRTQSHQRKEAKKPFVTTLIVRDGWYVENQVTVGGEPVPLPDRPAPQMAAHPPAANSAKEARTNSAVAAARGLAAGVPAGQEAHSPPGEQPPGSPATRGTVAAEYPPAAQPASAAGSPPPAAALAQRKVMQIITKSNPPPAQPVVPAPVPEAQAASLAETSDPSSRSSSNVASAALSPPPVSSSSPANPASALTPPSAAGTPSAPVVADALVAFPGPAVGGGAPAAIPVRALTGLPRSAPLPVAARERAGAAPLGIAGVPAASSEANPGPAAPPLIQALAAPVAAVQPADWRLMLIFGGLMMAAVLALLFVIALRRGRAPAPGSIITQSMGRR